MCIRDSLIYIICMMGMRKQKLIVVNEDLWLKFKAKVALENQTMSRVLEALIRLYLEERIPKEALKEVLK